MGLSGTALNSIVLLKTVLLCSYSSVAFLFSPLARLCATGDPVVGEKDDPDTVFMEMICPPGTNPDDSPLYVLCCNDTCSFTWTGAEHINQVGSPCLH